MKRVEIQKRGSSESFLFPDAAPLERNLWI